jgi:hypothetical protein
MIHRPVFLGLRARVAVSSVSRHSPSRSRKQPTRPAMVWTSRVGSARVGAFTQRNRSYYGTRVTVKLL